MTPKIKNFYAKHAKKILILLCALCLILSIIAGGYMGYRLLKIRHVENVFSVVQKDDIEYLVHLKENPYINQPYLGMDENYLYSYTDYVELRSHYSFLSSQATTTHCDYEVTATIISRYNKSSGSSNNPDVMSKTYILDQETLDFTSERARIDRTYDIFLEPYKSELEQFASTIKLDLAGEVRIDITVTLTSPDNYNDTYIRGITIPLSSEFYTIETHGDTTDTKEHKVLEKPLSIWAIIALSLLIIAGIAISLISLRKLLDRRTAYHREVSGYLKSYDDIIINTSSPIDFRNYRIVNVESFKEMLNLSNKTNTPIMFWEYEGRAYFYILSQGLLFLFTVRNPEYMGRM
ncbi:MAG: DUF5305 domain-containing protein [Peptococcaceae bacterium]|nr:DUF5305 domain-containing protein [Peptococcaceae bacterium]